jgi:hypothetical protein
MSAYSAIARLVAQHDFLPIELVSMLICGTTGSDDVHDSYSDPSWKYRNKAYDDMGPEDVRAAARAAREYVAEFGTRDEVVCSAFAMLADENTMLRNRLENGLSRAAEASRKRKLDALRQDSDSEEDQPQERAATPAAFTRNISDDEDEQATCVHDDDDGGFQAFMGC